MNIVQEYKKAVLKGKLLTKDEALALFETPDTHALSNASAEIRDHFTGSEFYFCSIINAKSGLCSEDCKYCAQSSHYNGSSEIYPLMDYNQIKKAAANCAENGIHRFSLVTSGRNQKHEFDKIIEIYRKLKADIPNLSFCASLGFLDKDMATALKNAGVTRYHHNLETSERMFPSICTTHTYAEKIATIITAAESGLEVCTGGILGMGETKEDIIDLFLAIRELPVRSIPINFLSPVKGTPMENVISPDNEKAVRTLSIARFILPDREIRLAGGRYNTRMNEAELFKTGISGCITGNMLTTMGSTPERDKGFLVNSPCPE